jgi:hypothetical protein
VLEAELLQLLHQVRLPHLLELLVASLVLLLRGGVRGLLLKRELVRLLLLLARLGFGRIFVSGIEAPNLLAYMV